MIALMSLLHDPINSRGPKAAATASSTAGCLLAIRQSLWNSWTSCCQDVHEAMLISLFPEPWQDGFPIPQETSSTAVCALTWVLTSLFVVICSQNTCCPLFSRCCTTRSAFMQPLSKSVSDITVAARAGLVSCQEAYSSAAATCHTTTKE